MIEDAELVVKWAMEIADNLPEKYQQAAFAELLRHALKSRAGYAEVSAETPTTSEAHPQLVEAWQKKLINELPEGHLVAKGTRDQQTVWAVISLWGQGEKVTSESIRKTIKMRLGVAPQNPMNTAKTLRKLTPKYVDRQTREKGRGYAFTPTAIALEIFERLGE